MTKSKSLIVVLFVLCAALMMCVWALFHGYFDRGQFEIRDSQQSSSKKLAMLARRSDHEALNGDVYFVLIGDHLLSPTELRRSYHGHEAVFATNRDCLNLHWEDSSKLVVSCIGPPITSGQIDVQQRQIGDIAISYINIPSGN
jgi:hypothetical protein